MTRSKQAWQILSSKQVYDNPWITLDHFEVIAPTGKQGIYGKIHFKNFAIGVLPIDENGYTWLIGQHRFCFDAYGWELPEGGGPLKDDPLASAKRELAEETGLQAENYIQILNRSELSNSVTDEVAFAYIATGLSHVRAETEDETEVLEQRHLPLKVVFDMVESGQITDMFTLAILMRAYHLAHTGRLPEAVARHFQW
jgi:8-oxo-dGTP pyrophosphatase MutT (NUDIX family)